jgi:histidyl-tRNA synthetase
VSRLLAALKVLGKVGAGEQGGPVVVLALVDKTEDRGAVMAKLQGFVRTLREAGVRAELYLGAAGGMNPQLKYANKRGSTCVVIQGSNERAAGQVSIKDLVLGATLSSAPDRETYLRQQAEAQFAVPEADIVAAVRRVLARHA